MPPFEDGDKAEFQCFPGFSARPGAPLFIIGNDNRGIAGRSWSSDSFFESRAGSEGDQLHFPVHSRGEETPAELF